MKLKHGPVVVKPDGSFALGYYFDHDGMSIWDPYSSECGRFQVDPTKHYGLTAEEAATLKELNEEHYDDKVL